MTKIGFVRNLNLSKPKESIFVLVLECPKCVLLTWFHVLMRL